MQALIEQLPDLKRKELLELQCRVNALLGGATALANAPQERELETVAAAMNFACGTNIPLGALLKSAAGSAWRRGAYAMAEFVKGELKAKTRADEIKGLRLLFRYILKDLAAGFGGPIPATPKTLAVRMERVAEMVDRHFPAYRAAGLLPVILQSGRSSG